MKIINSLSPDRVQQVPDELHARALESLFGVIDPEIGIDIVNLGLVYDLAIQDGVARVEMTMTTPACPLHAYLTSGVEAAIRDVVPEVGSVDVNLTFDPPWDPRMMSSAAKELLGWS